jgi:transcriptional regulator with GAF, ATPase, and Fis domain/lipopolysaccharide biosynthesis regulator YciM
MEGQTLNLSEEQWDFLALLKAFDRPVPIEAAGALAPLLPGPLMDLLEKTEPLGWIEKPARGRFAIGQDLPEQVREKLNRINGNDHLSRIAEKVYSEKLDEQIGAAGMLNLLDRAGRHKEAAQYEIKIAHQAVETNDLEKAHKYLEKAVRRLYDCCQDRQSRALFISGALEFSNLCFSLGVGFQQLDKFLLQAQEIAGQLGDQRSHALTNLHLGRLYYFTDRRDDALVALSLGHEEIRELEDEDILGQSAVFLGIFYYIKGLFKEAIKHFERAEQVLESGRTTILTAPTAPLFLGYCAIYLGQFHRAIGRLDYYWRMAVDQANPALASTLRSVLGTVLVLMKKHREASVHLQEARKEAEKSNNALGLYLAGGAMALMNSLDGRIEETYNVLRHTIEEGCRAGLVRQFSSPWILEMVHELHRLGFEPLPGFEFPALMQRILDGVNVHLRGVALRLSAKEKMAHGVDRKLIQEDLAASDRLLAQSGDRVQQSKTIFEMARLELREGKRDAARNLVHRGRRLLGGYVDEFFPNEFKQLIDEHEQHADSVFSSKGFLHSYLGMIESLYPSENRHEILVKVLTATSGIFGAERSGLFWFKKGQYTKAPELRAACNLNRKEVQADRFGGSMAMILKTYKSRQPQVGRLQPGANPAGESGIRSVLCIPIEVQDSVYGVLYYDNSYLDGAFDFLDPSIMKHMARHTNLVVERRLNYLKVREERNLLASEKSIHLENDKTRILACSTAMAKVLEQVDQVAQTESTIIITGETGTGKELLARRIHRKGLRASGPFIVVDSTTIPENLLESELFGHEKGAFTGAEKRKIGRIELAHRGTLFMDEIGELPLAAQAKLLRALQEKEFNRVGGTRVITSNFRLVAATNRDLIREVERGRFREDLYFRLNVIPIHLPPLRERKEDIALLSKYFLNRYAKKYKRHGLTLTRTQEKMMRQYKWPGNVRELQNIMERAVLLSSDNQLEIQLPAEIQMKSEHPFADLPSLEEMQRRYIKHVLEHTGGKIAGTGGAAQLLGLKRTSLYSRMKILEMKK